MSGSLVLSASDPTCSCSQLASCGRPNYPNRFTRDQVSTYVARVGADTLKAWIPTYVLSCLLCNRMSFYGVNLDCPPGLPLRSVNIGGPGTGAKVAAVAGQGLNFVIPGLGALVGLFAGIFAAHHAQAVAKEQSTECDVINKYNTFADAVEPALQAGQIDVATAVTTLHNGVASLLSELAGISNSQQQNAGFGVGYGLKALALFNAELVYPALRPSALQAAATNPLAIGAVGLIGAKVAGVF